MSQKKTQAKNANTAATAAKKAVEKRRSVSKNAGTKRAAAGKSPRRADKKRVDAPRTQNTGRERKSSKILELITRPDGATLPELMEATSWQAHSVRGFLSTAAKKHGLKIESTRNESGQRHYHVAA